MRIRILLILLVLLVFAVTGLLVFSSNQPSLESDFENASTPSPTLTTKPTIVASQPDVLLLQYLGGRFCAWKNEHGRNTP